MPEYVAGVDVGGTTVKIGLFPRGEKPVKLWEIPTPKGDALFPATWASIEKTLKMLNIPKEDLKAIGMGLPGPVTDDGFMPAGCVNSGLLPCNAVARMEQESGILSAAGNDANAAALGEMRYGAARGHENVVLLTLGTGVGSGIIVGGKVLAGPHGCAGEVGHFVVNPEETEACNCGNRGCLEQYASATGIVRSAKRFLARENRISVLRGKEETLTAKDVADAAKAGDGIALEAMEVFGKMLGLAVAHLMLATDPEIVVLGGGVSKAGTFIIDLVEKYSTAYTHIAKDRAKIVLAALGNDAGAYGAAALAEQKLEK